ncbi:MAG: 3-hydroxybutyryl-CoA dehydrogenase [Eubacterium sp.]|nr:3-hydroxybutyryl-CoA dehydrogenase [Eubacterium sp.]
MIVGVIGAGTMGSGIAQAFAQCDKVEKVYLCDIKQEFADGGFGKVKKNLERSVSKGRMDQAAADAILAKFSCGLNDICTDADLIVEAALENMQIKRDLFKQLDEQSVKEDCILASNTSSMSITEIGEGIKHPTIGMHFFNPAPVMKLVEVIAGANTSEETVEKVKQISVDLGKTPVQVNEGPGFVVNRLLVPMINEGITVLQEGIADIEGIDNAMKLGCNHPMGPLELGDTVGLDVCLAIMDVLYEETHDPRYRACTLLRKMVRGKMLGAKTGKGFYIYNGKEKTPNNAIR